MKLHVLAPALLTATFAATLITACGGGGSSSSDTVLVTPATAKTTLSGVASKGPLKFATVSAYAVDAAGLVSNSALASVETDATGAYLLDLGGYSGAVQLVVTVQAKTRTADEATGVDQVLPADFKLRANTVVAAASSDQTQSASVTAYTELAHQIAVDSGGLSKANIANASKVVFDLIGVDPVATRPIDASVAAPAGATDDQKRYALYNAAVSKLASTVPTTGDSRTLACFSAAGSDAGKKIQCATAQIASAVTVTAASGTLAGTVVMNNKLVGLSAALVSASGDEKNKTGAAISADDAVAKRVGTIETDAAAGKAEPIKLVVTTEEASDISKARLFFARLRANAAALEKGPLDSGVSDGIQAFGDSVRHEALLVTDDSAKVLHLAQIAQALWTSYAVNKSTSNVNSPLIAGFSGGCTVYQGAFPTQFGGAAAALGSDGKPGAAYQASSLEASSAANAAWVGCSVNQGATPTVAGKTQYRRSVLFHMAAAGAPATLPYIAITRARFVDGNRVLMMQNLTPTLRGSAGYSLTDGALSGVKLVGDLPPTVSSLGVLQAARYVVDLNGTFTTLASGAHQATLAAGSLAVVPLGATAASLTLDLSVAGGTVVVTPELNTSAAQLADAKLLIAATIKTAKGELNGILLGDRFTPDGFGDRKPGHAKFTGTLTTTGTSTSTGGVVATVLTGTLEATRSPAPVVSFEGSLSLPNRPLTTLSLSVSETSPATASSGAVYALTGRYAQDAVTVQITGSQTAAAVVTLTLADSGGVSVSLKQAEDSAKVTVSGRATATVNKARGRITYSDGTFESLG